MLEDLILESVVKQNATMLGIELLDLLNNRNSCIQAYSAYFGFGTNADVDAFLDGSMSAEAFVGKLILHARDGDALTVFTGDRTWEPVRIATLQSCICSLNLRVLNCNVGLNILKFAHAINLPVFACQEEDEFVDIQPMLDRLKDNPEMAVAYCAYSYMRRKRHEYVVAAYNILVDNENLSLYWKQLVSEDLDVIYNQLFDLPNVDNYPPALLNHFESMKPADIIDEILRVLKVDPGTFMSVYRLRVDDADNCEQLYVEFLQSLPVATDYVKPVGAEDFTACVCNLLLDFNIPNICALAYCLCKQGTSCTWKSTVTWSDAVHGMSQCSTVDDAIEELSEFLYTQLELSTSK